MYKHILISTDGSELAQKGVDHGLALAGSLGSKVTVVTITTPFPIDTMISHGGWVTKDADLKRFDAVNRKLAKEILSAAKALAGKTGLKVRTLHVPDAVPANAIVDTARELDCDLIVMASHGRRGLRKVLLGSQTSEVLVTSTVPVLVVR